MDLLLQAAKVLESENSGNASDRAAGRSARGSYSHASPKSKGDAKSSNRSRTLSSSSSIFDDFGGAFDDDGGFAGERRRAGGSGREVHNQLEKNRRKQLREFFNQLQQCIPSLENKRVATHSILQGAIKHIKNLKKKDVEQEREIQMLAKKKSEFKKKYDLEFNKCGAEQQRKATEMRMLMEKSENHYAFDEEEEEEEDDDNDDDDENIEGNVSDSTSTATEGPDNEEDVSDEEKGGQAEKPNISRVNPIVAAKLDGFRKRKLATLDLYPKSTDYIIASMKDAGYLSPTSSKQKPVSTSSVSSSSAALKNMLEQKKRQQSGFAPAIVSRTQSVSEPTRPKVIAASRATTKLPSSKGISSLTSSHPMISNQLASATAISNAPILTTKAQTVDRITPSGSVTGSSFSLNNPSPAALSLANLQSKIMVKELNNSSQPVLLNPTADNAAIAAAVVTKSTSAQECFNPLAPMRTSASSHVASESVENKMRALPSIQTARKSPPTLARPVNIFIENLSPVAKSGNGQTSSAPNHTSPTHVIHTSQPVTPASNKVIPAVFPFSLIQGLALNHGIAPVAVTSINTPSNTGMMSSTSAVPLLSAVSPILQPKIHPSEIFIASPIKSDSLAAAVPNSGVGRVTTLLTTTSQANGGIIKSNPTFVNTLPVTNNVSSSVTSANMAASVASVALPETLKTMALTPNFLPFTVTTGPLPANSTSISPGTPLRLFTPLNPSSVVASPLTNGQTSMVPAVVQLDGSGQVTVLQNFVQLQASQMLGQPVVVVTTPNSMIAPVTSSAGPVNATHSSSASGPVL